MRKGLIYKYTSKTTKKSYIGKTIEDRFEIRQAEHRSCSKDTDRAYKVALFLGYKSGSFTTKMKQKKLVVDNWMIIDEGVETIESID